MPQLDLMTFFTQFFWFSLGFSFFYIFLLHFIMSTISLNLKFRKRRLDILANDINKKKEGVLSLLSTYDNILLKTLNFSRFFVMKAISFGSLWVSTAISKVSPVHFSHPNKFYIRNIGIKLLNLIILESNLKASINDKNWTRLWK